MPTTPNLGLTKPNIGDTGWGTTLNSDFDIIDAKCVPGGPSSPNLAVQFNASGAFAGDVEMYWDPNSAPGFPTLVLGVAASGNSAATGFWKGYSQQAMLQSNTQADVNLNRVFGIFGGVDNPQDGESAAYGVFGYLRLSEPAGGGSNNSGGAGVTGYVEVTGVAPIQASNASGVFGAVQNRATAVVAEATALAAGSPTNSGAGSITKAVGLHAYAQNMTGVGAAVGVEIDDQGAGNNAILVHGGTVDLGAGEAKVGAPASAPNTTNMANSQISFYLDEAGNNLKVAVKYSSGVVKTATIPLV